MTWWHIMKANSVCAHNCVVANCDCTDNLATHPECHIVSNFGLSFVPEVRFINYTSAGINPTIIPDDNPVRDHDSKGGMHVESLTDHCARAYVSSSDCGNN